MPVLFHPSVESLDLVTVLSALADPVRLQVVRYIADDQPHSCGEVPTPLSPASMSRHFRILREAGVITTTPAGKHRLLTLRRGDLEARFPGLLASVGALPAPPASSS
ncbi:ArsR/SmtB family transcription factor [Acidipropionibacterium jensenii]|uniref:ArsR/SmtB family transcription factor n=1 Tax=Acidipropionibacterium jensenii TaxID=1749 RepID=UPI00048CF5E7|nr:helix-turn-helix domain-containing protein [Acidipropionibacterium jensenii]MDN6441879.1 helix-turn-helix domain-containing protein [Acidipropionibacterium jensenii]MDN6761255.1 helix-turn-helix domain-containing protein [Acidipropionibacterium jensenii]QCV87788.1 helix-turn-helix transcriptional regulator [Acidipropionibacterium jensenii]